jgi:hypothetical protein
MRLSDFERKRVAKAQCPFHHTWMEQCGPSNRHYDVVACPRCGTSARWYYDGRPCKLIKAILPTSDECLMKNGRARLARARCRSQSHQSHS